MPRGPDDRFASALRTCEVSVNFTSGEAGQIGIAVLQLPETPVRVRVFEDANGDLTVPVAEALQRTLGFDPTEADKRLRWSLVARIQVKLFEADADQKAPRPRRRRGHFDE